MSILRDIKRLFISSAVRECASLAPASAAEPRTSASFVNVSCLWSIKLTTLYYKYLLTLYILNINFKFCSFLRSQLFTQRLQLLPLLALFSLLPPLEVLLFGADRRLPQSLSLIFLAVLALQSLQRLRVEVIGSHRLTALRRQRT